jgi:transcription elongation factor GreA-like protein
MTDRHFIQKRQAQMTIKNGSIVSHAAALEWGVGKVLEVTPAMATIQFSDGKSRKIAASHFAVLQPAAATSYNPPPTALPQVKTSRGGTKKKK